MKATIMCPKKEFTKRQQKRLSSLGVVKYTASRKECRLNRLVQLAKNSEILAFDPDNIGGFEVAPKRLIKLIDAMPKIRGLALSTTAFGYVDLDYCKKRNIIVTNIPYYSTESVAEHVLGFLLGCAKKIFLTDRRTQKGKYRLEMGLELKAKTLGVIGLGNIGSRVAELGKGLGMKVIAWNRSHKKKRGVVMKSLDKVLAESDAISLNIADCKETEKFLSRKRIKKLKKGTIVINTVGRETVDEKAMTKALKSGQVNSYALEAEDLTLPPLGNIENAFLFQGFGWHTKEALERNKEIWVKNIEGIARGKLINPVN